MLARVRSLKAVFLMLNIAKLMSIQYQEADSWVRDPTDLTAKVASNLILFMIDIVLKCWRADICKGCSLQVPKAQMLCSLHIHLSCPAQDVIQTMRIGSERLFATAFQIRV